MGVVYRARNLRLNRPEAIKMIIGGKYPDPTARVRFLIEAEAVAQLDHPNVVHVYEFGTYENLPFFALEFVGGGTVAAKLAREGKPSPKAAAELVLKLAGGIAAAHAKGIIHRDLKPGNVLLTETGEPKIVDFGLAKVGQSDMTTAGAVMGTPSYMSPEQAAGRVREVGAATDVYALGAILFELLTGKPPFKGISPMDTIHQVLTWEPQRPRTMDPAIPRDLETICLKCLEKDAKSRYAAAVELAADLQAFLAGRPIQARPVGCFERAVKWVKRNPVVTGAAIAVAVALVAGTTVSYLKYRDAQEQKGIAEDKRRAADQARERAEENERAERWGRYRANVAAASAALQVQNSVAARSALEDAPPEHRNWEWHHFHTQLDGSTHKLTVPGGPIRSLVLSPSGRQAAVCSRDHNEVYLYAVATGKLEAVLRGHSAPVTSVAYRPDGLQIATADVDQTIRLWNQATAQQTALLQTRVAQSTPDQNHILTYNSSGSRIASYVHVREGVITSRLWDVATGKEIAILASGQDNAPPQVGSVPAAFSPDGKRVLVCSGEYVYVCDAISGRQLAVLGPGAMKVNHLAFSSDGKRIISAVLGGRLSSVSDVHRGNAIRLWDGESGKEIAALPTPYLDAVQFSPDGSMLITGSAYPDNTARIWDAATGRLLHALTGNKNGIPCVSFSPDGRRAITAGLDLTARIWDVGTGKLLSVLGGHTGWLVHVLFSPDNQRIVTAAEDSTLRYWDAQTGELIGVLLGHVGDFPAPPVFTTEGTRLVSGSTDGTVRIWDVTLLERNGILKGHESYVYDVAFSPNGEQVASAAWDGSARLWDVTTGRQSGVLKHAEKAIFESVSYTRDGRRLATADRLRGVTLWDVAAQKPAVELRVKAPVSYESRACINPEGTLLASGSFEGTVFLWDAATGQEVARLVGHESGSVDVAFHPDGRLLASTSFDGTVRLWDVATRAQVAVLRGHDKGVWRVAFDADRKLLASCSIDKTICFWDVQTHERLAVIPLGSVIYGVAFSPDGTRLAAGCRDNTIRLIDVARRQQVAELRGHTDYVHSVGWSPDGTRLVSGSGDYTVRVWDSLTVQERARRATTK
jgi:WD40 repeat protein